MCVNCGAFCSGQFESFIPYLFQATPLRTPILEPRFYLTIKVSVKQLSSPCIFYTFYSHLSLGELEALRQLLPLGRRQILLMFKLLLQLVRLLVREAHLSALPLVVRSRQEG